MTEPTPFAERELAAIDDVLTGREIEPDLADIGALTRVLRAERPAPAAQFARELDAWAAEGFGGHAPRPSRKPAKRHHVWLRPPTVALAGALAAVAIGVTVVPAVIDRSSTSITSATDGGGSSGGSADGSAPPEPSAPSADPAARADDVMSTPTRPGGGAELAAPESVTRADGGAEATLPAPPGGGATTRARGRSVEQSAALGLATPPVRLEEVAAGVSRVTDAMGGFVARSTVDADPNAGSARFELRIPAQRLTSALAELSELANVRSRTQSSLDITRTVRSADDRLEEGRAERRGLLRRLAVAPSDSLRARLRRVTARIAEAKADLGSARRRASVSRVTVTVTGDRTATERTVDDGRWTPADALRDAARVLEVVAGAALVALAVALPLALLAVPLALMGRRRVRRGRERALDAI